MKIKESRAISFIIVAVVYVLASIAGIITYGALNLSLWLKILIADTVATVVVFVFSLIFRNASVYDPYWSVQPIVILVALAFSYKIGLMQVLFISVISLWGIRLTANWAYTFKGLTHQDWRHTNIQHATGKLYPIVNFLGIHYVPTLIVYACTMPAVYVIVNKVAFNAIALVGLALSLTAIILQCVADIQMHSFRKANAGGFIRTGVWKYSRHPNYLAEILMWWGIGISAVCLIPNFLWMLTGCVLNTMLFLFISIPLADNHQSRKTGFADYKAQTNSLIPLKIKR